ncbi:signal-transducing adaptor protein 2-like [Tautogolabrus adspersus]
MAKRAGRQRSQLPTCYYEGYLEKRSFKVKTSRKLWTCLCGNSLFFFNDKRDTDAPNAEARELWKGFIHSVAELSVPTSLNLLPGQLHMLREAVEQEKERIKPAPPPSVTNSSPYISLKADKPACYQDVPRLEAELLLEREAKRGNLLLRPGRDGNSFAVTTRQDLDGSVFRHYRVTCKHEGGFSIDVDTPVPCATLHDVINYLVEKTEGVLIPLTFEGTYERRISFIWSDSENGEKSVQQAPSNLEPPSLPPKPASRIPTPEAAPAVVEEEDLYLNDQLEEKEREPQDSSEVPLPRKSYPSVGYNHSENVFLLSAASLIIYFNITCNRCVFGLPKAPKRAVMPPIPALRKWPSSTTTLSSTKDPKMKILTEAAGQIPQAALTELKLKLEQKAMCLE